MTKVNLSVPDAEIWEYFRSDVILTVETILTEPVCPEATISFELPSRAGLERISKWYGNTIDEAIQNAIKEANEKLSKLIDERKLARNNFSEFQLKMQAIYMDEGLTSFKNDFPNYLNDVLPLHHSETTFRQYLTKLKEKKNV